MKVKVLFFAAAKDVVNTDQIVLEVPVSATIQDLSVSLMNDYPELRKLNASLLWAVNNRYCSSACVLNEDDTVACFPPVSGG